MKKIPLELESLIIYYLNDHYNKKDLFHYNYDYRFEINIRVLYEDKYLIIYLGDEDGFWFDEKYIIRIKKYKMGYSDVYYKATKKIIKVYKALKEQFRKELYERVNNKRRQEKENYKNYLKCIENKYNKKEMKGALSFSKLKKNEGSLSLLK